MVLRLEIFGIIGQIEVTIFRKCKTVSGIAETKAGTTEAEPAVQSVSSIQTQPQVVSPIAALLDEESNQWFTGAPRIVFVNGKEVR